MPTRGSTNGNENSENKQKTRMSEIIKDILAKEAEEAEEAEERRRTGKKGRPLHQGMPPRDPAQVYSLRMPVERLGALRRIAGAYGANPTALMRTWVLERLAQEERAQRLDDVHDALERLTAEFHDMEKRTSKSATKTRPRRSGKVAVG
jgi:hypothetical protein